MPTPEDTLPNEPSACADSTEDIVAHAEAAIRAGEDALLSWELSRTRQTELPIEGPTSGSLQSPGEQPVEMPQPLALHAADLLARGSEYLEAFEVLTREEVLRLQHARYFLLTHALELILKSYLALHGTTKKEIRFDYGHDLNLIFHKCRSLGLADVENLGFLVEFLNEIGSFQGLRYPNRFRFMLPQPEECAEAIRGLIKAIDSKIYTAAVRALFQFSADTRHLRGKQITWSD